MSEEHSWLSLPLSEQSATPDRQGLWQCPEELLQDLGVSLFLLLRSPPPVPWGASEQSRLLPPFSLRAHPVGWAAAVGPEPGCVAGAGACFVLGASVSCIPKVRSHLVSFPLGSIRPFIAREIQVFERYLLSVFPQSLAECAARGKGSVDGGCRHRSRVLPSSPQLQKRGAAVPTLQVENPAWRRGLSGPTLSGSQQWDLNPGLFTSAVGFFFFSCHSTLLPFCAVHPKPSRFLAFLILKASGMSRGV